MNDTETIKELIELRNELLKKIEHIDNTIDILKSLNSNSITTPSASTSSNFKMRNDKYKDYKSSDSLRGKIAYILKTEGRFLHVREIALILHSLEPNHSVKEYITKISPAISYLRRRGVIVKVKASKSNVNTFWGSKNWIDKKGEVIDTYKYDESQILRSSEDDIKI